MKNNKKSLSNILKAVAEGKIDPVSALHELGALQNPEKLDFVKIDHTRKNRCGFPEFIYGEGKTPVQIIKIIREISRKKHVCLVTRLTEDSAEIILKEFPKAFYDKNAKVLSIFSGLRKKSKGKILIGCTARSTIKISHQEYRSFGCPFAEPVEGGDPFQNQF